MSSFTEPLWLTPAWIGESLVIAKNDKGVPLWRTARAFAFDIGWLGSGWRVEVPEGTLTDLGTIPRWLWWILPPHDPEVAAAFVLHDYLRARKDFSVHLADALFLHAMDVLGVVRWKAVSMYCGVRLWALFKGI